MNAELTTQRRNALERRHTPWQSRTTAQLFDDTAATYPDRVFVRDDAGDITYAQMQKWSIRLAAGMYALGIRSGNHVAVDMANLPDFVALKLAAARIGAISVSINFLLRHEELEYILRQSDARLLITMDEFRGLDYLDCLDRIAPGWEENGGGTALPSLEHVFVRAMGEKDDVRGAPLACVVAVGRGISDRQILELTQQVDAASDSDLLYTSGTTGKPKGAMLTHDGVVRMAYSSAYTRAFQDARTICYAMPMYHVFGYVEGMIAAMYTGGSILPMTTFDPVAMLSAVSRHQIDELICVPAMTTRLLEEARAGQYDLDHLTTMFSSGAAHHPDIWQEIYDVLTVDEIFTAYGQTETTASTACTLPGDPIERLQTTNGAIKLAGIAGDPAAGGGVAAYRVIATGTGEDLPPGEIGELLAKGVSVTRGYYNKPEETSALFTADGWMHTGDLGRISEDGYITLTGRIKESYRCGGELVLPAETEGILSRHPGVKSAHVIGVPHDRMGEVGVAFVVPSGDSETTPQDLIEYCTNLLARFKVPAYVFFIEESELPVTVTGRVQKFRLTQRATAALASVQR